MADTSFANLTLFIGLLGAYMLARYTASPPRFLQQTRRLGLPVLDGLSMLVHQGAIGFQMWAGLDVPLDVMRDALREAFAR